MIHNPRAVRGSVALRNIYEQARQASCDPDTVAQSTVSAWNPAEGHEERRLSSRGYLMSKESRSTSTGGRTPIGS